MRMRKRIFCASLAAMLLGASASAAPLVTNGDYTAYIGENNWLYLVDANGGSKYMRTVMGDLVGMDNVQLTCLTQAGALWAVKLDGTASSIVSLTPGEADFARFRQAEPFTLENGVLRLTNAPAQQAPIAENVLIACADANVIYYVIQTDVGLFLRSISISDASADVEPVSTLNVQVAEPLNLFACNGYVTLLAKERFVQLINVNDWQGEITVFPAVSEQTVAAVYLNGQLIRYAQDAQGNYNVENIIRSTSENAMFVTTSPSPTPAATRAPSVTATATPRTNLATARPTAATTSRTTNAPTATPDDGRISKGDRGFNVQTVQQRLLDLGYPISKVDGVFGDSTLQCVNLFQFALGKPERNYLSLAEQKKLYAEDAPVYDPYLPLLTGDRGTPVLLMQQRLQALGFNPGKLDGVYGTQTCLAVAWFQQVYGFPVDGTNMSRDMLMTLFRPTASDTELR